jgi:hypothetical protein
MLISVYVDPDGGASWYAQLRAFDDAVAAGFLTERVSEPEQLVAAVRRWLEAVLDEP